MTLRTTSLVLAAALVLGAGACASKSATGSIGAVGATPTGGTASGPAPTTPAPTVTPILPDGRSPVYLTRIDVAKRTLTFDLIDFLTGDAAKKAWKKAYPNASDDGPPNDYFIVNDNPKLRTLPVADPVVIKVVDPTAPSGVANKSITFAGATAYFASIKPDTSDHKLAYDPFWITVKNGVIVKMEEQFLP